jgi:uridylate kinase
MNAIAEPYIRRRAQRHLHKGRVVIFGGGTGNPFFTTDTAAALRASEMDCDLMLMAKNGVDGVYSADPKKDKLATRFSSMSYDDVIQKDLRIIDTAAISLCRDKNMPIAVFDFARPGAVRDIVSGLDVGTVISNSKVTV